MMKVNPAGSTYLACALLMRGNICTISDLQENVARMKHRLTMVVYSFLHLKFDVSFVICKSKI